MTTYVRRQHRQQPTAVIREHLTWLLTQGMTRHAITADTGVSDRTLYSILNNASPYVRGGTAAVLLATRPRAVAETGLVPALGTIRRLKALVAYGYTTQDIADRTGLAARGVRYLIGCRQPRMVEIATRNAVADLFERLSATPGPSENARRTGRARRWAPPAAWTDIDNPAARPYTPTGDDTVVDPEQIRRALAGTRMQLTRLEMHHAVHHGINQGIAVTTIAELLHINHKRAKTLSSQPLPDHYALAA
jgi:hypothetical protein